MSLPTSRESEKYVLRLPAGMRERIKAAATRNNRTMNAEIVAVLEEKFPAPTISQYLADKLGPDSILELINTEKDDLPAAILKMNKRMEEEDMSMRFAMRKGKVQLLAIGEFWTEDMAIEVEESKE
jgi:hypothetical protein